MSWRLATRLAPAYCAEMWGSNQHQAKILVWRLWFANVETYGTDSMKRIASELRKTVERDVFTIAEETPLFVHSAPCDETADGARVIGLDEQMRREKARQA